jgi:hypothetical protein
MAITFIALAKNVIRKRQVKKRIRKRGLQGFRVKDPLVFFAELEKLSIKYVVLRSPRESETDGDYDILIDVLKYQILSDFFYQHYDQSGIKLDIYSVAGGKKLNYRNFPYYPPLLSRLLIENSVKKGDYYILLPKADLLAYTYHVVYQKSLNSGIPTGFQNLPRPTETTKHLKDIRQKISLSNVIIDEPINIKDLRDYLVREKFSMPYDQLSRWAMDGDELQKELESIERKAIGEPRWGERYIFVYMLRDNIEGSPIEEKILNELKSRMNIIDDIIIAKEDRKSLALQTRGGNWIQLRTGNSTLPYRVVVVHDEKPKPLKTFNPDFPLVDNEHFYIKSQLREIATNEGGAKDSIHGSDNVIEAEYIMQCVDRIREGK